MKKTAHRGIENSALKTQIHSVDFIIRSVVFIIHSVDLSFQCTVFHSSMHR